MAKNYEDQVGNPITHYYRTRRTKAGKVIDFSDQLYSHNPIPLEIRDPDDVKAIFKYFVPYSHINGYTADSFLNWLVNIADLSPTHGSVKKKKIHYAFNGNMTFSRYYKGNFHIKNRESDPLTELEQSEFVDKLMDYGFDSDTLRKIVTNLADNYIDSGTAWIEVVRGNVLGEKIGNIYWHDVRDVRFWHELKEGVKYVGVSKKWNISYIKKNKIRLVPVYPNWAEEDGVERTFIQIKYGTNFWYGKPQWLQALFPIYNEMKDSEYLIKASTSNFISKYIIEAEEGDNQVSPFIDNEGAQELGYKNFNDQIRQESTVQGDDPSPFIITERPAGADQMAVFELKPNSNEDYFDKVGKLLKGRILEAHDWNEYLMGEATPTGLNDTSHIQKLKVAEGTVLKDIRKIIWDPVNLAIREIMDYHNEELPALELTSQNPLQYLIDMLNEADQQQSNEGDDTIVDDPTAGDSEDPLESYNEE